MDIEEQYDKIFHYCYYRIRDKNVAEDITQEVFLRFYNSNYVEQQKEIRYLYTIARNICIDEYRKRNIYKSQIEQLERCDGTGQTWKAESDGGAFAEAIIEKLYIENLLVALSDEERDLLVLRFVNDEPISLICDELNISRFALYRSIRNIKKKLNEENNKNTRNNENNVMSKDGWNNKNNENTKRNTNNETTLCFIMSQFSYISWYVWCISLFALIAAIFIIVMKVESTDSITVVSASIPFVAMAAVMESFRSKYYGMSELESVTKVSFRGIYFARTSCIGMVHIVILSCLIIMIGRNSENEYLVTGAMILIPYLITSILNTKIERTQIGRKSIFACITVSVLISGSMILLNNQMKNHRDFLPSIQPIIWYIVILALMAIHFFEIKKTIRQEVYAWN